MRHLFISVLTLVLLAIVALAYHNKVTKATDLAGQITVHLNHQAKSCAILTINIAELSLDDRALGKFDGALEIAMRERHWEKFLSITSSVQKELRMKLIETGESNKSSAEFSILSSSFEKVSAVCDALYLMEGLVHKMSFWWVTEKELSRWREEFSTARRILAEATQEAEKHLLLRNKKINDF